MAYNLFISHSWAYGDAYDKLSAMLRAAPRFEYKDYSVPKNDPIHNAPNAALLRKAISDQMRYASVVLIMAGKYATYSKWINEEIKLAQTAFPTKKPIIAITPWGAQQISSTVRDAADEIVGWSTSSIADAIRRNS
ncbi:MULTISPECIES: TIR domain-containing protein [unclassified Phaeobacter]|uniref:TIR domain-containing protein n=1 Tax=unclassified Phaeobacter TaxID=2621772 RepID=UPI003A8C1508